MFQDHYESQLDKFKESFLTEAARCGRTEEVASLIELGASPNGDQTQNQDTPLLAAVRCNHIDVATILIAHGANINAKTIGGNTALHLASSNGNEEMCALLLSSTSESSDSNTITAFPELTSINDKGFTPFDVAVEEGFLALGETLRNISDTTDDANGNSSDGDEDDIEIRDRFLAHGTFHHNTEMNCSINSDHLQHFSDNDDPMQWQNEIDCHDININTTAINVELKDENSALKKALTEAEKALTILGNRCNHLERKKQDFIALMEEVLTSEYLSKQSIDETERLEDKLRDTVDRVVASKMSKLSQQVEHRVCVICQVEPKTILLMPCRHLCVCKQCSTNEKLESCPLCRQSISEKMVVYS